MAQRSLKLFPRVELSGVESRPEKPELNLKTWFSGDWQKDYDRYFTEKAGLRGQLVRTWNQVNFTFFGKVQRHQGTHVIVGRDRWLYEQVYIDVYNRADDTPPEELDQRVRDVKRLQDELAKRDIAFVLVVAPSKVEVLPEHVPPGLLAPGRAERRTAYDRLAPMLAKAGVNLVDARRFFMEKKNELPYPLFSRGGVHWNYYGAGLVVEQVIEQIERQTGRDLVNLSVADVVVDDEPRGTDNDLGDLLNVWQRNSLAGPQVHPVFDRSGGDDAFKPRILLVGDSFARTLAEILDEQHVHASTDVMFYLNRRFSFPGDRESPVDRKTLDWSAEILGRDAVIIEINEYWLPKIGFGFVERALNALDASARP
jgi:hypothetical protein